MRRGGVPLPLKLPNMSVRSCLGRKDRVPRREGAVLASRMQMSTPKFLATIAGVRHYEPVGNSFASRGAEDSWNELNISALLSRVYLNYVP